MQWREAVISSLTAYCERRRTAVIQRQAFIDEQMASIVGATNSTGTTPTQTLSRVLQDLRDEGLLAFLERGEYLFLDQSINVEDEELTDEAIDKALRGNRLHIGMVPTDTQEALVRQRRGQSRLRQLTLENYGTMCAVCDIVDPTLLVTSHIVGWAEAPEYRGNLSNVICLCRIHDALFEAGYWSLDDCLRVLKKESVTSKVICQLLDAMGVCRLPVTHPPNQDFVSRHRKRVDLGM